MPLKSDKLGVMSIFLNVKPQYLTSTFQKAEELHGSFDGYVKHGIGVSDEIVDMMRKRYLI